MEQIDAAEAEMTCHLWKNDFDGKYMPLGFCGNGVWRPI